MTVTTSKTSVFAFDQLGILVKTSNQSIKKQPCLWLIHGSGGISSNEDLWTQRAFENGYTVVTVDSYSNRGIFKQYWEDTNEYRIPSEQRAQDQLSAYSYLQQHSKSIPFADITNSVVVGFSDGGTAGIWLQQNDYPDLWKSSYCLYPGLFKDYIPPQLYNIRKDKTHIFVGELDNWTPAEYAQNFAQASGCKLTIYPDAHHSFSKPGITNWHEHILNPKGGKGVFCGYNHDATEKTMHTVFNT